MKEGLSQSFPTTAAWKDLKRKYPGDASPEHGMTHTQFSIYKVAMEAHHASPRTDA
jgi:hypothetical protein